MAGAKHADRRRPIRTATLTFDGDYEGSQAIVRLNPTMSIYDMFGSNVRGALKSVIIEWNFVDENGEPVSLENDLAAATDEEISMIVREYLRVLREKVELPKD